MNVLNERKGKKELRWAKVPQTKQDKQREAEEHARMLRRERIMREIELGALNTKRYRTLWREMMMRIKMPRIAEDVEVAWRNFDRALDIKDYRISFLMDALTEAKEQYQKNARSHAEIIDQLLRTYNERVQREESNYRRMLSDTLDQTDDETDKLNRWQNEDEISLQSITRGVQRHQEESLNNVKSITLSKIDAFVEDNKDIRRISGTQLENQLQNSWEDLQQVLLDYENSKQGFLTLTYKSYDVIPETKDRQKSYEAVKEKDEMDQRVIAEQLSRTTNFFDEIRKLRNKIATYDTTTKKNISEILIEHNFFQKAYWSVKNRFLSEQDKDKDQLKVLSIEYNRRIKDLERLVGKGKQLLTLMQICRKYETQDEKIIPFVDRTGLEDLTPPSHRISDLSDWNTHLQIAGDFQDLTNFWRRLGAAQIITIQLRSERDKLKTESNHLHECLNSYMMQKVIKKNKNEIKYKII